MSVNTGFEGLADIPAPLWVAIGVLWVIEVGLALYALVNLYKLPAERVVTGKKWVWVLVILFINLVGPIIYLVAGRKPVMAVDPARQAAVGTAAGGERVDRATAAADLLYGTKEE